MSNPKKTLVAVNVPGQAPVLRINPEAERAAAVYAIAHIANELGYRIPQGATDSEILLECARRVAQLRRTVGRALFLTALAGGEL
jgi:hypothetical protein